MEADDLQIRKEPGTIAISVFLSKRRLIGELASYTPEHRC